MKTLILLSAITFSATMMAIAPDPVLLERLSKGINQYSTVQGSSLKVLASGRVMGEVCRYVELQTSPPQRQVACADKELTALSVTDVALLKAAITDSQVGAYVEGPPAGQPVCAAVPTELVTYWVHDGNCPTARYIWSGYTPCGRYWKNNTQAAQELVNRLDLLFGSLTQPQS